MRTFDHPTSWWKRVYYFVSREGPMLHAYIHNTQKYVENSTLMTSNLQNRDFIHLEHSVLCMINGRVAYRGGGALGFPTPSLSFPPPEILKQ